MGQFDMVVIGGGPGGYVAAIRAAQLGLKTALVEKDRIGGRCLNYACIPAKAVLRSADILEEVRDAGRFGVVCADPGVDWQQVSKNRDRVIKTMTGGVRGLLKKHQIVIYEGTASLGTDAKVIVSNDEGNQTLSASNIVLATGSSARPLKGAQFSDRVVDTAGAWLDEELPRSLAVIGAGASGVEIASAFGRFGAEVALIEMADQVLPAEDSEVAAVVASELAKQNVEVATEVAVERVEEGSDSVSLSYGGQTREFERVCIATGRAADTESLDLSAAGVNTAASGLIETDAQMKTSVGHIYAIGDLVEGPALAHKASDEGVVAAEAAAGLKPAPIDVIDIPKATFCRPQVASFGLTEDEAREQHSEIRVGRAPFGSVGAATVYGDRTGFVKIIASAHLGELLGAHIVGPRAADLISELIATRSLEGGIDEIAHTVHAHPTLSEGVLEAAREAAGWGVHT